VAVLVVVPLEESHGEVAGILDRAEAVRVVGPVLDGLEVRLGEGVVVGDVGTAETLGDAKIREQQREGLGGHGCAAVGVAGELSSLDAVLAHGVGPLICSDPFEYYEREIRRAFPPTCVYVQVRNIYRRDWVVRTEATIVLGTQDRADELLARSEDSRRMNTSFIERLNLHLDRKSVV
jgi:hypothetical protein